MEALRVVEREQRPATEREQRVLARWSGWGALPVIFNPRPGRDAFDTDEAFERAVARWDAVGDLRGQIRALLTEDEWAAARRNTINAHYTDADLVRSIWGAVRGLGFRGGRVLEPGSGSGNFIGFAPILMSEPVQMTGVEVEPTTAAIARHLYPDAEIITRGLEEVPLADGGFDGVVGNVPYGRYKRFDKVHNPDLKLSIHTHFILKSLYATRPGGIVALITSRYTLDGEDPEPRERMYQLGDLVGAVRLPARAHATAAGTDVVTDVLFLRRRMEGEEPGDPTWLTASKRVLPGHDNELAVNTYFDAHPEYVLGELRAGSREWGPEVTVVGRTDQSPAEGLAAAAAAIGVEAEAAGLTAAADQRTEPVQTIVTGGTEGALGLDAEGNPTIIDGGRPVPLEIHPDQREQLVQLIRLKGLTLALYAAEADTPEPGETPELARLRAELRVAWRDYRKSHPPLTKPRQHYKFTPPGAREQATAQGFKNVPEAWKQRTAFAWIDDDPDASLLFGLEEWDDRTGKGTEQKVLLTRVLEPRRLPTRANSHEDAIALATEYDGGRLDMTRVASLLGTDEESAAAQCADAGLAYRDPQQEDAWEPSHRYLSGNVRTKLAAAKARAADDPTFLGNVAALERVQPDDLAPSEIKAKIGAPWVPVDVYNDFLAHLGFEDASVVHAGGTVWEVRGAKNGDLARTEWGTGSRPTQDLFTALLRQADSTIQVTYRDSEGRTYVDKDATDAAQEKAKLIAEAFEDWVWDDKTRAARLAKLYNEMFNNLVLPDYSGSALSLPGLISDWTMKEHQNAAIRRIVHEPTALLAHVVGAGKTATMAAGAMELRRTGLAKKPCLVVPNHMLKQWSREFRQLYPNAKILTISASDLNKKRRAKFMGRIAGGDWDAVILTHEAFNRVPLRPENMRSYLDRELASLRSQLDIAAEAGMHKNTVKQIEESLANAEAKLQQQIESMGDDNGVFLEDTGVDYLFLDEAHEYKNLRTVSAIPGAAIQGSAKATKLHMVLSWLRETNDSERVATLATGTPIANSVTEAYVLKRYLAPQLLDEMGLDAFDNWAATFGEVVSNLEPDPKGDGYKYKARFSRFFNVPELMGAYRTFADVQMAEDLNLPTPPVRENEDGQRGETVIIPPTPAQRKFIEQLPYQPWVRKPGGVLKALGEGLRASVDLDLVDATEALRSLGIDPSRFTSIDPATGEAEIDYQKVAELADAAATDMRSVGGSKEMGSKVPYAAEKIVEIWQETKDIVYPVSSDDPTPQDLPGGLQLVFLDEGTPGSTAKHGADLYADLRDELVARGMPRDTIRFIHEASTDKKKEKLFADCRAGRVRVLIGSTQKMGTGTNIQDRATALHHLSYPWRPADMAQRDGRIERRGNLNAPWVENTPDHVRVLYYITERTFDEFRLTTLARKARFIGQIQRRDFSMREIEDIGADAINIGMLAALASGDPAILQLAEATAERSRFQGLARSWDRAQDNRSQQLKDIDDFLGRADTALEGMREAAPNRRSTTGDAFAMTVEDATYRSRDAAANALGARMVAIAGDQSLRPGERIPVGTFGGQDFHAEIAYGASGLRQMRLRFAWGHVVPMGQREDRAQWQASSVTQSNGRGAIQSLEHFLNHLDDDLDKLDKSAASLRGRREEITANLRPKDENPYRIQARSKEREERALGKLVVANKKEAALAERAERAEGVNEDAAEEVNEELTALREHIANLRKSIADEHQIQARAQGLVQPETRSAAPDTAPDAETAAAEAFAKDMADAFFSDGSAEPSSTERPASGAEQQQDDTPPAEPQEQPDPEQASPDTEPTKEQLLDRPPFDPNALRDAQNGASPAPTDAQTTAPAGEPTPTAESAPATEKDGGDTPTDESTREADSGTASEEMVRRLNEWWETSSNEDVPAGYQPFSDASVQLQPGDTVRAGWRQYEGDKHLHFHTVTVEQGPDPRDGYYVGRNESGNTRRFHPRAIVAVPDGSRLLSTSAPTLEETPVPAPAETEQEVAGTEQTTLQGLIEAFGGRASVQHIGGPQPETEPAADEQAPTAQPEPEQHTGPSPAMARCAAVLRYYEPLLKRHKLSGRDAVAFIDRPGVGYRYEPGNPLPDLIAEIGKVGERVGGSYRVSYSEWVNYEVGERRQQQSDTLTNLSIDLLALYSGETEPLFTVDLEAILAAPPGTVIELESEAEIDADEAAAARIVILHDAEGTEVRNTPRGGDQRIRDALNDLNFNWSRRQQKWYQQRDTPLEDRDTAVRGLRVAFDKLGVPYTYNGPDLAPQDTEETTEAAQQATETPSGPEQTGPAAEASATDPTPKPEPAASTAETDASPQGPADDGAESAPGTDGTKPARTHQSAGWAIMAVLSEDQVKGLVSAVTVDSQPISTQSRRLPGDRVREWIAEQQQAPTSAFYASNSSDLPPAVRGAGGVRLSTRADGLTIERGDDVSTTILWEELPAWIDAAVAHNTANRDPYKPWWRYGSLDHEIHFRRDDRNTLGLRAALDALADALRETTPPTDEQLAEARDRFAPPAGAADAEPAPDANASTIVQTPDGPGTVVGSDDGGLVLVNTQSGTRVWESSEIEWPEDAARPENTERAVKERQNAADLAQAATAEGIELRYGNGNRLVDLDVDAGHGTVVDTDGAVIGWVRARIGDDGRRYWWGQDARGGAPDDMPFHEALPASSGPAAIRAAGTVRTDMPRATEPETRRPTPAEYAAREVRLTTAQVRELRRLVLDATYSDGSPIEPPEWVAAHRKYVLNTAQMQALGDAAQAAADAFPGVTAEERRTARVLRNAAERFEFEVYDTARWRATIPPIGEADPYAGPYRPRPRAETTNEPEATPDAPAPTATETSGETPAQTSTGSETEPAAPADTGAPEQTGEPDLAAAAHLVDPAPYWRIVGAETDEQATVRFGGPERMRAFAARVRVVPAPSALTETSADVWMDGRMVGRIADVNDVADSTVPDAAPLWNAEPVFGTTDRRLARFRSQEAALAELAVRALRSGPPAPDRLDEDMTASFTASLVRPETELPPLPDDDFLAVMHADLVAVLDAFAQGRSRGGSIAEDLAAAYDSLLWLSAAQTDAQVRDDLETRADTASTFLNVFDPDNPRAAQNRASAPPDAAVPGSARTTAADIAPVDAPPENAGVEEEAQLDLFPTETPESPAPARRTGRRRTSRKEPAVHPGTEDGPDQGRLGVYGHAENGDCDRCGTPDTHRYTMVWSWYTRTEDGGDMAAECGSCVELTTGLSYKEYQRLANVAEARRGGRRIVPRPYLDGDVTVRRTAENEWTCVHLPTGKRYRLAEETPSGYRGFVLRDLHGVSQGTGISTSSGYELAERAALGRTPQTHPNDSDDWVFFGYNSDIEELALHEGENINTDEHPNNPRRGGAPFEHGPRWEVTVGGIDYQVELVYQPGQPGDDGHRLEVTGPDGTSTRHVHWDGVLEWAREQTRDTEPEQTSAPTAAPLTEAAPPPSDEEQLDLFPTATPDAATASAGQTEAPAPDEQEPSADAAAADAPAPDPAAGEGSNADAVAEPAPVTEPGSGPTAEETARDDAPAPDREADEDPEQPDQEEAAADEPEPTSVTTDVPAVDPPAEDLPPTAPEPAAADGDPTMGVDDPPAPQYYTEVSPLPADAGYQLHLTGLDGQGPSAGELRYGESTIAAVHLSASGRWFARMTVDGMPADVTALTDAPKDAADLGALMFSVFTGTPYGKPPVAAAADGPLSQADVLRSELRAAAQWHLDTITVAAARVTADYTQNPQFQELSTRLNELSAAVTDAHGSRQMAANLTAVQQAVNAWGGALPVDPALDERQHLAFPLTHLLYDTTRLHGRLQATMDAVQAERAAAREQEAADAPAEPAVQAEPVRDDSAQQTPVPTPDPAPDPVPASAAEPVRGPRVSISLWGDTEEQVIARVETGDVSRTLVLPGVSVADLPEQPMPVAVGIPMLVRPAQRAEHLVADEETEAWLAVHLPGGLLAPTWDTAGVRAALVVAVRDTLRDGMAPSVDDVAAWLVNTAAEQDDLLRMAHAAAGIAEFRPLFAQVADSLVTDGGSEYLLWTYLGDEGTRRDEVLALAAPGAYEQLLALPAPADALAPERAAAAPPTEQPAPSAEAPEDPEMATPARPATPEDTETATPAATDGGVASPESDEAPTEADAPAMPIEGSMGADSEEGTTSIEEPPEPRRYFTPAAPLAADPGYQLHLSGLDGQAADSGELRHGDATVATLHLSAAGRWFARLTVDGLPADVTTLADAPEEAADQGAVLFSAFTGTPYGEPPTAVSGDDLLSRANVLRTELRDTAIQHLDTIVVAAAQVTRDYEEDPRFQELALRLDDMAGAVTNAHGARQMATQLDAVQQAVNAWGSTLPVDPDSYARSFLAHPLAHLLYDTTRLHGRLQATLDAVQAERAAAREQEAAPAVPAEPVREDSAQQTPPPAPEPAPAPEPVGGPVVALGLREGSEGQLIARVDAEGASHTLVLPGVTAADLPGLSLPVAVQVPMLTRPAQRAEHLVTHEETETWLAGHLPHGPMAPAWNTDGVRQALISTVRDTLRDGMAPSVDDFATWLVQTAAEHSDLIRAAHTASLDDFTAQFAQAADAMVTNGGSDHRVWAYLAQEGGRRAEVLALAAPSAYEQLRALPAPADAPAPEQAAASPQTEPPAPRPDAPEDPEMATPARPATPENPEAAAPAQAETVEPASPEPFGDLPLWTGAADTSGQTEDRPVDVVADFASVKEAWDETVPADKGTGEDLFADVQAGLLKLQQMLADAVPKVEPAPEAPPAAEVQSTPVAPAEPEPVAAAPSGEQETQEDRDPQQEAGAVNTALGEADGHAPALQDLPEWQRIQTVRGAFGNLMRVIRERAGEHFGRFMGDGRVAGFFRKVSIRACEKIAGWAQAGADKLRRNDESDGTEQGRDLPSAEALLRLGDAALEYSGPRRGGGSTPPPPANGTAPSTVDIPEMRKMGEALERPMPGATKHVSTSAARGRSTTTRRGAKNSANGTEQAGHLRRDGAEQQPTRKPNQR
ncbi:DEAD/DEAH box helicase family protein [Streptomyces ureilyticus]|uniref:DEAD/DEAH box helicase family protein n=1 Tax=Streptomyces ureilyticus TaxID=1775131 RepID=A0ABX0DGL9_9ACTN|nr:SNF2-related protein [Streptomyces ureilyticus]NGO40665.1 DEAD/DEAH box helicase family protein [Streptomyces ureilyticus]